MAIYNGRKYIMEQLDSIMKQSRKVDELILIDDNSSEFCDDIIEKLTKTANINISYKKHYENKGYAQTFFEALSLTTGDYIFFSDQDDIWFDNKVEEYMKIFDNHCDVLCLSSRNIIIDGDGNEIKREKRLKNMIERVEMDQLLKQTKLRPGMSIAIRKQLKKEILKFDTSFFDSHDRFIEYLGCRKNGFYLFGMFLTKYRIHGSNTSGLNLAFSKLRSNRLGRIKQIDKEVKYLKQLKSIDRKYMDLIDKNIRYYQKRKLLLEKTNSSTTYLAR